MDDFFAEEEKPTVDTKADAEQSEVEDYSEYGEHLEGESEESSEEGEEEGEEGEEEEAKKVPPDLEAFEEIEGESEDEGEEIEEEMETIEEEGEGEEGLEEEAPPDPTAPYNLSDESEAEKAPFSLSEAQMAEVTELWDLYQAYTPAYNDIVDYITEVELVYMLRSLNLHTFTPEQTMELIEYCVKPPDPNNHILFPHFVHIITIRQRDMPDEEEIRLALEVMDPEHTGLLDRENLREVLRDHGNGMKTVDAFIKEVDMSNDGTLGLEDIVGTICIDLNRDDIQLLKDQIWPPEEKEEIDVDQLI